MNRETGAAVTAVNTALIIFFMVVIFGLLNESAPAEPGPMPWEVAAEARGEAVSPEVERGWAIYQAERCSSCHAIAGQGSPRYPLDGVASRNSSDELRLWVVAPQQVRPGVRKRPYPHLSEDEVAALVALLEELR